MINPISMDQTIQYEIPASRERGDEDQEEQPQKSKPTVL
jgi:hypothetical protein